RAVARSAPPAPPLAGASRPTPGRPGREARRRAARPGRLSTCRNGSPHPYSRGVHTDIRPPRPEHHHRDIQGGKARAAVFGVSDGLVSNVSLILGVAGASTSGGIVRLAGLAGLIAGSVSMAAGEYVSMQAQRELLERELDIERRELARRPH